MKVLVIGSGGREHAICKKLSESPRVGKIYCAPGNGGIAQIAETVPIRETDTASLLAFAKDKGIELTVVGGSPFKRGDCRRISECRPENIRAVKAGGAD